MKRTPVSSSNIRSIGYDPATQTLEVEFLNGGIYHYHGVPPAEYQALMAAASHGTYLNAHIKGRYPYTRVG